MSNTYRAIQAQELGGPAQYRIVDLTRPNLKPGQLRIRMAAAGVSFVDVLVAAGGYQVKPPVPYVAGLEGSGTIIEMAEDVAGFAVGDAVAVSAGMGGALAEEVIVRPSQLIATPKALSLTTAATVYLNYQTAYYTLVQRAQARPGETVLVLGASGGVGAATIDVARALGATVIAAASTEAKRAYALERGATHAIDAPSATGWRDLVKAATGGGGPDIVVDPIGGEATEPAFRSLAWNGRMLIVGFAGGQIAKLAMNLPLLKGASLIGVDIRQFREKERELADSNVAAINMLIDAGKLRPRADLIFPFERFADAMAAATDRDHVGRVALSIAPEPNMVASE